MISVQFTYLTGLKSAIFHSARLAGSWNGWSEIAMQEIVADDGCPAFTAIVSFDDSEAGRTYKWGVRLDAPGAPNAWAINLEIHDAQSEARYREFQLPLAGGSTEERYYFTEARRLGAQKWYPDSSSPPKIKFSVWAPNANNVKVVFARPNHGYISDDGTGIDSNIPGISLLKDPGGIWTSEPDGDYSQYVGLPYMFQIENAQGDTVYRTDIHSRWQIGAATVTPRNNRGTGIPSRSTAR